MEATTIFYQTNDFGLLGNVDEIPIPFEAHWLNLLTAPICAC